MNFDNVTAYLDSLREKYDVRCTDCKIIKGHETIYRHMTGTADYDDTIPISENNLHDVYSASKVLTMIAVMQLIEQSKIGLEDELEAYLPEYKDVLVLSNFDLTDFITSAKFILGWPDADNECEALKNKIRIKHLMSMTAGLSYNLKSKEVLKLIQEEPHATTREIVSQFCKNPLLYEPGTRYAYSLAHDVLAAVVEEVSGMTFGAYMKKYIFDPLNMTDIYYQVPENARKRVVELYDIEFDEKTKKPIYKKQMMNICRITDRFESGGGGIACTVDSYIKALEALANGGIGGTGARILKPESILLLSKNQLNEQQLKDFHIGGKLEYGYGLGVRTLLNTSASKSPLGEFGWDGAAGAYVLVDPKNKLSLFYVQAAKESGIAFSKIHPTLRDLVYDVLECC